MERGWSGPGAARLCEQWTSPGLAMLSGPGSQLRATVLRLSQIRLAAGPFRRLTPDERYGVGGVVRPKCRVAARAMGCTGRRRCLGQWRSEARSAKTDAGREPIAWCQVCTAAGSRPPWAGSEAESISQDAIEAHCGTRSWTKCRQLGRAGSLASIRAEIAGLALVDVARRLQGWDPTAPAG